jgi:cell division protein ZapE
VLLDARTDFRLEKLAGVKMWHVHADDAADDALDLAWAKLTGGARGAPLDLIIKGRRLHIPRAARGVARFSFKELCETPLGASDYLRIAHDFHSVVLDHVPVMHYENRNAAKRFITLIDTFYDNAVKLVASAEADPTSLYRAEDGVEVNEFKRTSSRLIEMGSESYLMLPHGDRDELTSGSREGLIE